MFHLTHIYVANKIAKSTPTAELFFGSTIPDISEVSRDYLSVKEYNGNLPIWARKLKRSDLKIGALSHHGVDLVSHGNIDYSVMADGNDVDSLDGEGDGVSFTWFDSRFPKLRSTRNHTGPEYFMELYVTKTYPYVFDLYERAIKETDMSAVAIDLAQALDKDSERILDILHKWIAFTQKINFITKTTKSLSGPQQDRAKNLETCIAMAKREVENGTA
jgi:hypothetical protein